MGDGEGIAVLERQEEQYIVSPDDLKRLGRGECVMTLGGSQIYHLKVPMLKVTKDLSRLIGPPRVNRWRRGSRKVDGRTLSGADFFSRVSKYLTVSEVAKEVRRADSEDLVELKKSKEIERRGLGLEPAEVYADE